MNSLGGIGNVYSSSVVGQTAMQSATMQSEQNSFDALVESMKAKQNQETLSSSNIIDDGRLNGDYTSGFAGSFTSEADKNALPTGAAANSVGVAYNNKTIDRTSKLYEKSLELESYFVKIMLNSMKSTLSSTGLNGEKSYAQKMYEDMLYDELAVSMTKNGNFGIADQIYLELV
ncbi:MAG: rod-binding protein [Treponemataceae bacterium]|nr:rod-binding protein [Treponemataceae bacterium]